MNPWDLPGVREQGGGFCAKQARAVVGRRQFLQWLQDGQIVRESHRFYRLADCSDDARSRMLRAQARFGEPLIACYSTAAELHGFGVVGDNRLHVATMDGRSLPAGPDIVIHQLIRRAPLCRVDGLRSTDAAESAVALAAGGRRIDVLAVLDAALRAGVTPDHLAGAMDRAAGLRGVVKVRDLLPAANPLAESPMESRTRQRVIEAGLPEPELQVVVRLPSGVERYLDHGWRRARVGLEYDGQDFHSGDGSLDRDRRRHAELLAAGWTIVYVTATDVYRTPERMTNQLRGMLGERGALPRI